MNKEKEATATDVLVLNQYNSGKEFLNHNFRKSINLKSEPKNEK